MAGSVAGMQVNYELSQRDFLDAFKAHRKRSTVLKWVLWVGMAFVFTLAVTNLILVVSFPGSEGMSTAALPLALACLWALVAWAARNQYRNQPAAKGSKTLLLDAAGLDWRWNTGSADVAWTHRFRFLESERQFLFYSSPVCFNIAPKQNRFRILVAENLPIAQGMNERKRC
jgi:hypothetical protein